MFVCVLVQALADAANFIVSYNMSNADLGDWVVFGCSYSGALSAWFRAKYPNLVVASVAPSGPVEARSNFTTFLGQFSNSATPTCVDAVKTAVKAISVQLTTPAGRQSLQKTLNACNPLEPSVRAVLWGVVSVYAARPHVCVVQNDFQLLVWLAETVGSSDQMNNPPTWILNTTCNMLTQKGVLCLMCVGTEVHAKSVDIYMCAGDIIENFAKAYNFNVGQADAATCNNFQRSSYVKALQSTEVGPANAGTCCCW